MCEWSIFSEFCQYLVLLLIFYISHLDKYDRWFVWTCFLDHWFSVLFFSFWFHWYLLLSLLFSSFCLFWVYFALFFPLVSWGRNLCYWFETILLFQCEHLVLKFPFQHCFSKSHLFSMFYFFSLMYLKIFLRFLIWPMDYLEMGCLISKCWDCPNVFLQLIFVWFHYGQWTIYDFNNI